MFMEERQLKIAELIEKKGHITIAELTTLFDISHESARRDLRILESKGLCKRTHGGALKPMPAAAIAATTPGTFPQSFSSDIRPANPMTGISPGILYLSLARSRPLSS